MAEDQGAQGTAASQPEEAEPGLTVPTEAPNLLRPTPPTLSGVLDPDEEATLAALQAKAATAAARGNSVQMRITSDHSRMDYGLVTLTNDDWTTIPANMAGPLATAAADAGVTIEQKEG